MKPDMPKRCVESAKAKMTKFPRGEKPLQTINEESIKSVGMTRIHRMAAKSGEKHYPEFDYAVMRRFLLQHCGKPWDQVYSEICTEADARSFSGHQVRHWLEYMVEKNCTIQDGEICDDRGLPLMRFGGHAFYVHPETGVLEHISHKRTRYSRDVPQTIFEMKGKFYYQHDGIWYRVDMQPVPWVEHVSGHYWYYAYDKIVDAFGTSAYNWAARHWSYLNRAFLFKYGRSPDGKEWYCAKKESANHREITRLKKKYNLTKSS